MPDSGRKDLIPMKRPLAYITAPWSENEFENSDMEDYIRTKLLESLFKFRLDR